MKKKIFIIAAILIACVGIFLGVYFAARPAASSGTKAYRLTVCDDAGTEKSYSGKTDTAYLAELFQEIDGLSVIGEEGPYGFTIVTVNGLTADSSVSAYWAIYVNGDYGQYGASEQPVNDGDEFALKYENY